MRKVHDEQNLKNINKIRISVLRLKQQNSFGLISSGYWFLIIKAQGRGAGQPSLSMLSWQCSAGEAPVG